MVRSLTRKARRVARLAVLTAVVLLTAVMVLPAASLAGIGPGGAASARVVDGIVRGTVKDPAGVPVRGALVELFTYERDFDPSSARPVDAWRTRDDGVFLVGGPGGPAVLRITPPATTGFAALWWSPSGVWSAPPRSIR